MQEAARVGLIFLSADVAVLGVPDNEWGEKAAAVVVVGKQAPSADGLAAWVKARLRSSKTPEVWAFREALPNNDTGKLLRRQLKAATCRAPLRAGHRARCGQQRRRNR